MKIYERDALEGGDAFSQGVISSEGRKPFCEHFSQEGPQHKRERAFCESFEGFRGWLAWQVTRLHATNTPTSEEGAEAAQGRHTSSKISKNFDDFMELSVACLEGGSPTFHQTLSPLKKGAFRRKGPPVSYTHLTLPTKA